MTATAYEPGRATGATGSDLGPTLRGQMPVLDALRGVAILMVIAHRAIVVEDAAGLPARLTVALLDAGWVGVQLFFVLSGFLITGILLDSRGRTGYLRSFFARRVLRIFPLYYAVLIGFFGLVPLVHGQRPVGWEHQGWLWVYLANWAAPFGLGVPGLGHFWSLCVEEQFYLAWPFVVAALAPRRLAVACAALVAAAMGSRFALHAAGLPAEALYSFTICRVDALAMGGAAAWALREPAVVRALERLRGSLVAATALIFAAGAAATRGYPRTAAGTQLVGYSIIALVFVVTVVYAVLAEARGAGVHGALAPAPLRSIGKYSYAMYVFHALIHAAIGAPALKALGALQPAALVNVAYFVALSAASYLAALGSYHLLEERFLRLKVHFPVARQ